MPLNISLIEDAWLGATADFEKWKQEWEAQFFEPLLLTQVRALWSSLTPQQKVLLRDQMGDEAFQQVIGMVNGGIKHGR